MVHRKLEVGPKATIEKFVGLVQTGVLAWSQAGEMLVNLVNDNPNVYSEIIKSNPNITFEMLLVFEKIGRRQIYPPLLMDNSPAARLLMGMPYEMQEKFSREPVEIVVELNGEVKLEKRYIKELSHYEAQQVFTECGVRPLEMQKEFIKTHGKRGRPKRKLDKGLGSFIIKLSPSGSPVIEKCADKILATQVRMFEKDGVQQCVVKLVR